MGILEGEGTFLSAAPSAPKLPVVRVSMTDEDVMKRVAALVDRAVIRLAKRRQHHRQPFATTIKGAPAEALMRSVQPWLGERRRAQIDAALADLQLHKIRWRRPATACAVEGCSRACAIRGLCRQHYALWWKARRRGQTVRDVPRDGPVPGGITRYDVAQCSPACDESWLAGLLEGEGYFGIARQRGPNAYPTISVQMCDEDVVRHAAAVLGTTGLRTHRPSRPNWSVTFAVTISGAHAADWMRRLRPLMGERRRAAIDRALAAYTPVRLVRPPTTCVIAGCDAPHRSRGLCHRHYMSWVRDVAKGRTPRVTPIR